jgi:hypothetical protein
MSQMNRKFIGDNQVAGEKIRLDNGQTLRARNAANTADVDVLRVRNDDVLEFKALPEADPLLPVPSSSKQFATIEYIENVVQGKQDAKDAVNVLADANIALTGSTPLVIDGITVTNGMRIGLTGQTTGSENGIYAVAISVGTYTLARANDANSSAEVTTGLFFKVISGTAYAGYDCILTTPDPIVLDTTALTFAIYPSTISITAGDMLAKTGNELSVDLAPNGGLRSTNAGNTSGQLAVKPDAATLEKDQSVRVDSVTGAVVAKFPFKETFTLNSTDITNGYVDLLRVASTGSVALMPSGAGSQIESVDFTVNYTGGAGSKTRVTFAGGLAVGGVSALANGDVVQVAYDAFA